MRSLGIRGRLGLGFALALGILLVASMAGYLQFSKIGSAVNMTNHTYTVLLTSQEAETALLAMQSHQRGFLASGDDQFLSHLDARRREFIGHLDRLQQLTIDNQAQQARIRRARQQFDAWLAADLQRSIDARRNAQDRDVALLLRAEATESMRGTLDEIKAEEQRLLEVRNVEREQRERSATLTVLIGMALGTLIGALIAWNVIGVIGAAIAESVALARSVAKGDLTQTVRVTRKDEFGTLQEAMGSMVQQLKEMIAGISGASAKLAAAAEQVAASSRKTVERSKQQQDESTQAAAAMNQMTSTVQEIARSTQETSDVARESGAEAEQGKLVVGKTIDGIDRLAQEVRSAAEVIQKLHDDSGRISQVLDVIRGIAEQTNLLALNAAIEAARAGEHGRGFAVVADEVRSLATGTQKSIGDIEQMINGVQEGARRAVTVMEGSRGKVEDSVERAAKAGETLEKIVAAVARIQDMATHVASAVEEQTAVAESISRNVVSVKDIATETGREIREVGQAAGVLTDLARQLQGTVARFQVR
jgi:methyl-accepting chemotaxis protein